MIRPTLSIPMEKMKLPLSETTQIFTECNSESMAHLTPLNVQFVMTIWMYMHAPRIMLKEDYIVSIDNSSGVKIFTKVLKVF